MLWYLVSLAEVIIKAVVWKGPQNENFIFNQFMSLTLQVLKVCKYIGGWNYWDATQKALNITKF